MEDYRHDSAMERQRGAAEGEDFDRRLRDRERIEREERLSRISWGADRSDADSGDEDLAPNLGGQPSLTELRLERELKRLTAYYDAVENSRAWQITQRLRRLAGRAW